MDDQTTAGEIARLEELERTIETRSFELDERERILRELISSIAHASKRASLQDRRTNAEMVTRLQNEFSSYWSLDALTQLRSALDRAYVYGTAEMRNLAAALNIAISDRQPD